MIGIDIVSIDRIDNLYKKFGKSFLYKIFNEKEIEEIENINYNKRRVEKISGKFAAKEAVIKAFRGERINFKDVEILTDSNGIPVCFVCNNEIKISISHEREFAIAVAIKL